MGCHSFSRAIFPTQGSTPSLRSACFSQGFFTSSATGEAPQWALWRRLVKVSVVSDSLRPHGLYMDPPGHSTGVGGRFLLPGTERRSPALQADSLPAEPPGKACCCCCQVASVVSNSATPSLGFSRQEHWSGLPFPSPMQKSESEVAQSNLTLHDPMDCSPPGSSVHGIFQARALEWGAIAFSDVSSSQFHLCQSQ